MLFVLGAGLTLSAAVRPLNVDGRGIVGEAALCGRIIYVGTLIAEYRHIRQHQKAMGKAFRDIEHLFVIGEKGNKLSGGQKQKIALSRALYRKPKLLIIDEGTSNIDSDTEERILKRVKSVYPDMTIIIVSHRLSTVRKADRIIVLDKSQVAENGEYAQLLDNGTVFRKIFANQI